jgi:hypothetical protein
VEKMFFDYASKKDIDKLEMELLAFHTSVNNLVPKEYVDGLMATQKREQTQQMNLRVTEKVLKMML